MKFVFYSAGAILLASVSASPLVGKIGTTARAYTIKESIPVVPAGYVATTDRVNTESTIKLSVHIEQQNVEAFETKLYQISSPDHPDYGNHMSQAEISAMMAPHPDNVDAVKAWLKSFGIVPLAKDITSDSISFVVPVSKAEDMLHATYHWYKDTESSSNDRVFLRTMEYSVPENLKDVIAFVQPTTAMPFRTQGILDGAKDIRAPPVGYKPIVDHLDVSCNTTVTPSCLSYLYNFAGYKPLDNSVLGVSGFLNQSAQHADLDKFLGIFAPQLNGTNFDEKFVNGGENVQNSSASFVANIEEANLDIQYTVSISSPIKNVFISTGGSPPYIPEPDDIPDQNEPYLEWLEYLMKQDKIPETITTSYADPEQTVPKAYAIKVCNMIGQLSARGTSFIFSAGDYGVGNDCLSNDGKNTTRLNPNFPPSCPYVTAIGGTTNQLPEQAWNRHTSNGVSGGGGFSNYFPQPHFQATQVSHYLREYHNSYRAIEPYFNKFGRAIPDVSAQADNYAIILDGGAPSLIGGTSAAGPVFASIIALLNSERIKDGKPSLGWLNPWLYSRKVAKVKGLTDITVGSIAGCAGNGVFPPSLNATLGQVGFAAQIGWDPATGLGTPNFENLKCAL